MREDVVGEHAGIVGGIGAAVEQQVQDAAGVGVPARGHGSEHVAFGFGAVRGGVGDELVHVGVRADGTAQLRIRQLLPFVGRHGASGACGARSVLFRRGLLLIGARFGDILLFQRGGRFGRVLLFLHGRRRRRRRSVAVKLRELFDRHAVGFAGSQLRLGCFPLFRVDGQIGDHLAVGVDIAVEDALEFGAVSAEAEAEQVGVDFAGAGHRHVVLRREHGDRLLLRASRRIVAGDHDGDAARRLVEVILVQRVFRVILAGQQHQRHFGHDRGRAGCEQQRHEQRRKQLFHDDLPFFQ